MNAATRRSIIAAALLLYLPASGQAQTVAGTASVIDGDTLEIHGERVRLFAIDAPESGQHCETKQGESWRCGRDAAWALSAFMDGSPVTCDIRDIDHYRRKVAVCRVKGIDIGKRMVATGWAVSYRRYGKDYVADEEIARRASLGLWSGTFQMPWSWRKSGQRKFREG